MKFEHFALNVPDAAAQAAWYVEHLGFRVARRVAEAPYMHFLTDDTGRVIVELYSNPGGPIPEYGQMHPLTFHLAVIASEARTERQRLERAGATFVLEDAHPDGSVLVMLRDPWGLPLQLVQRSAPLGLAED